MSHKISFRERGKGSNLLLLHGYGGTPLHWEAAAVQLAESYRVILPNLSHLYMAGSKLYFSVQVEAVANFLRSNFPGEKFYVSGLSYGGALGWALALRHPELVERLVLVNPMPPDPISCFTVKEIKYFFNVPMNVAILALYLATPCGKTFLKRAGEIFRDERVSGKGRLESLSGRKLFFVATIIHRFVWILKNEDWSVWQNSLDKSVVPTMLLYDPEDMLIQEKAFEKFSQEFLCEKVQLIVGAGHLASKSAPALVAEKISEFCRRPTKKQAG